MLKTIHNASDLHAQMLLQETRLEEQHTREYGKGPFVLLYKAAHDTFKSPDVRLKETDRIKTCLKCSRSAGLVPGTPAVPVWDGKSPGRAATGTKWHWGLLCFHNSTIKQ